MVLQQECVAERIVEQNVDVSVPNASVNAVQFTPQRRLINGMPVPELQEAAAAMTRGVQQWCMSGRPFC